MPFREGDRRRLPPRFQRMASVLVGRVLGKVLVVVGVLHRGTRVALRQALGRALAIGVVTSAAIDGEVAHLVNDRAAA